MQGVAAQASGAAGQVQPLITAGAGSFTLAQVQGANYINAATRSSLEQGLIGLGVSQAQINAMNITQIQGAFNSGAASLNAQATGMIATAATLQDKNVDVEQTGTGYTPILGLNISPAEGLNIGIKYEFKTKLSLTNATIVDGTGLFPDKAVVGSDIPAIFSIGADWKLNPKFDLSLSFNSYHDKAVDWGTNVYKQKRTMATNSWEVAIGGQYQWTEKFAVSAGFLHTEMGISEQFQSDFSYYNSGNTFGGGFEWKALPRFTVDAGVLYTIYADEQKTFTDATYGSYNETYKKHNLGFALGLGYRFGGL